MSSSRKKNQNPKSSGRAWADSWKALRRPYKDTDSQANVQNNIKLARMSRGIELITGTG